jgi:hypothetical protein
VGGVAHPGEQRIGVLGAEGPVEHGQQHVLLLAEGSSMMAESPASWMAMSSTTAGSGQRSAAASTVAARRSLRAMISMWSACMVAVAPGAPIAASIAG